MFWFLIAVFTFALSVPLAAKMVPPNRFYGFRTPRVRKDERVWYPVNQMTGRNGMVLSMVFATVGLLAMLGLGGGFWTILALLATLAVGLVATFVSAASIVQQVDKGGPLIDYSSSFSKSKNPEKGARESLLDKLRKN